MAKNFAQVLADVMALSTAEQSTLLQVLIGLGKADRSTPKELTTTVEQKAQPKAEPEPQPKAEKQSKPASSKKKQLKVRKEEQIACTLTRSGRSKSVGFGKLPYNAYLVLKYKAEPMGAKYNKQSKSFDFGKVADAKAFVEGFSGIISHSEMEEAAQRYNAEQEAKKASKSK